MSTPKNKAAVALGKLRIKALTGQEHREMSSQGGLQGGRASADSLTPEEREKRARKAAKARWGKKETGAKNGGGTL